MQVTSRNKKSIVNYFNTFTFNLKNLLLLAVFILSFSSATHAATPINIGYAAASPDFYQSSELSAIRAPGWLELYLKQIAPQSAPTFNFVHFNSTRSMKEALNKGDIDIAFSDAEFFLEQRYLLSEPALSSEFLVVTKAPLANLNSALNDNMKISEYKGVVDFEFAKRIAPQIGKQVTPSVLLLQSLKNIASNQVYIIPEFIVPFLPNPITEELSKLTVKPLQISKPAKYRFVTLADQNAELINSFNFAITRLSEDKQKEVIQQSIDQVFFPALEHVSSQINKLELTEAEQAWVQSSPIIKVASANSTASAPFDIIDINNSYTGISADYLKLIGQLTGLKFVHTGSYSTLNIIYGFQEKTWDVFTTLPHRNASVPMFKLTDEYSYFSWNVISREHIEINSVSDLQNLTFVPLPYSSSEKLQRDNPNMKALPIARSPEEALELVSSGEADFTILPSHSAPKLITSSGKTDLKVAYAFNSLRETIHFGVRKDLDLLKQILDKAIQNISEEQHESIRNKWFGGNYTVELDWGKAIRQSSPLLIAISCLVIALFAWSRKLRKEVRNRIKIQKQLEIANIQAKQATKAKSLFLSTMSHEIRTPMNGIIGMLELLADTSLSTEQKRMLTTINSSSSSLMQIINDILDFSKIESDKLEIESIPFSIGQELESICDAMTKLALDKGVGFYFEVAPCLYGKVAGDPTRFKQVITNLLSNAVKFTDHGQVSVIAKYNEHSFVRKEIEVFVKDTGIGMSKKQLDKLFQPFTQAESSTTRRFGGTGLGLAITQQLCNLMSFNLSVMSEKGHGTTFTLGIPVSTIQSESNIELWQPTCLILNQNTSLNKLLESYLTDWQVPYRKAGIELQLSTLIEMANNADFVLLNMDDAYRMNFPLEQFEKSVSSKIINMTSQSIRGNTSLSFNPLLPSQLKLKLELIDNSQPEFEKQNRKLLSISKTEAEEQGLLVLVAEDHPTNRLVLQKQLHTLGIHADFAEDGVQAWTNLQMKNYGLLLTDCHMPNMDGYTLAEKVRSSEQYKDTDLPVIALTASVLEDDKKKCIESGMNDVINKPATIDMLRTALSKWLIKDNIATSDASESNSQASAQLGSTPEENSTEESGISQTSAALDSSTEESSSEEPGIPQDTASPVSTPEESSTAELSISQASTSLDSVPEENLREEHSAASEPLYDHGLLEQMFGDSVAELLQEFCDNLDADIEQLTLCSSADLTQLSQSAHRIKGAAESIMAKSLAQKALVVEQLKVTEDEAQAEQAVSELALEAKVLKLQIQGNIS